MYEAMRSILREGAFPVVESFDIPARPARHAPIPAFLFESPVGPYLRQLGEAGMWAHQALALEMLGRGENVVVSTGTASGKSRIFQSLSLHKVMEDPSDRVIVFYPLRALVEDQVRSWKEMAGNLGLDDDTVGLIYGPTPFDEREEILQRSRILVMTPDVCQAWIMPRLAMPVIREFIRSLSLLVIDEAHTMEGVFGSNSAFLLRRLIAARNHIISSESKDQNLKIVASTATIADPAQHMKMLTGAEFSVVDHAEDGSERYDRVVAHIASPEGDELAALKEVHRRLLSEGKDGQFITFVDSRKGVESLAIATADLFENPAVVSYRAGFDQKERRIIENQIRTGKRRGVVSTSALELGIDFPHLRVGLNAGVPSSRKAYRQRLGRVGRRAPGAFVVIGPEDAFRRFGMSFREYHEMSVEPSYLYLDNRFMQFAHGRCLAEERESIDAPASLPGHMNWPKDFGDNYKAARPGGQRAPEFDAIAELGGDSPHRNYPLRNIGEAGFDIKFRENGDKIGDVTHSQALRECYPGGTYFHQMKAYEIVSWNASTFSSYIRIKKGRRRATIPQITTWINTAITQQELVDGNLLQSNEGFLAECRMHITERVEGYKDSSGQVFSYQELQKRDPNKKPKTRNFRTTGIVFFLDEDWFRKGIVKRRFTDRIREIFLHEYSIIPNDIGGSATNIAIHRGDGKVWRGGCIAIFDQTYGSLRLTEKLFTEFDHVLDRLRTAAREEEDEWTEILDRIHQSYLGFSSGSGIRRTEETSGSTGDFQVFSAGSRVVWRQRGFSGEEVEVIEPTMRDGTLMYRVQHYARPGQPETRRFVPADAVESSAEDGAWSYAWWNSETETYVTPNEAEDMDDSR